MKKIFVYPSILSADFSNLSSEIKLLKEAGADGLHVDIMDGHFVNNISFGIPIIKSLSGCGLFLDLHLMVTNPLKFVEGFVAAGANLLTFHVECLDNLKECILKTKSSGCGVGLAVKPATNLCKIESFLSSSEFFNLIDLITIMTVEPGFAGQAFMKNMLTKVERIRNLSSSVHVAVDGGVNFASAKIAVDAGADWLVAGTAVFGSRSNGYKDAVRKLKFCNELIV